MNKSEFDDMDEFEMPLIDYLEDDFDVRVSPAGRAYVIPQRARRLEGDQAEVFAVMFATASLVYDLRQDLDHWALEARKVGLPWSMISLATGLSPEGCKKRWSPGRGPR